MNLSPEQLQFIRERCRDEAAYQEIAELFDSLCEQANDQLRQERERFQALFERTNDAIFLISSDGTFFRANQRAADMLGYTVEEICGSSYLRFVAPEEQADAVKMRRMVEAGQIPPVYSRTFIHRDGRRISAEINVAPVLDAEGNLLYLQSIVRDLSERLRLQQELQREHNLLRTIIDAIPDALYVKDRQSRFILSNAAALHDVGLADFASASGTTDYDYFDREAADALFSAEQHLMQSGEPIINAIMDLPPGRSVRGAERLLVSKVPLHDEHGQIIGLVGINRDVTSLKRTLDALEEARRFNEKVTQTIPDLVYVIDLHSLRIVYSNRNLVELFGYSFEQIEMNPRLREEIIHPEDVSRLIPHERWMNAADGEIFETEVRLKAADGQWRWQHLRETVFRRGEDGRPLEALGVMQDVTEYRQAEQTLIENERLRVAYQKEQELLLLKDKMMMRIAHEFRTPLSIISTSAELLQGYSERMTEARRREHFSHIMRQVAHITAMLDDITLLMRVQSSRAAGAAMLCNFRLVIDEMLRAGMAVQVDIGSDLPLIPGDHELLLRMLRALVTNALIYSPPESPALLRVTADESWLTVTVYDSGFGIPPADLPRVFEPFYRGGNINEAQGIGLGLTIAQAVVNLHRGSIHIETALNEGTNVTVRLPIR